MWIDHILTLFYPHAYCGLCVDDSPFHVWQGPRVTYVVLHGSHAGGFPGGPGIARPIPVGLSPVVPGLHLNHPSFDCDAPALCAAGGPADNGCATVLWVGQQVGAME